MIIKLHHKPQPKFGSALFLSHAGKILIALAIFLPLSYFFFDKPIAEYFHAHTQLQELGKAVSDGLDPFGLLIAIPILCFFNKYLWHKQSLYEPFKTFLFTVPFALLVAKICKYIIARDRPRRLFSDGLYGVHFLGQGALDYSFPSGHACVIGAIFGAIACFKPKMSWLFLAIALVISLCRVLEGDHFLSDVVAGVVLGALSSQLLFIIMKKNKFAL